MHIADGVLSPSLIIGSNALAVMAIGLGIRKTDYDDIPRLGVLASFYFVVSLIHIPIGPFSSHLIMNGFLGLALGWAIFPVLTAAGFLQAIFFGFGGITSLGINVLIMGLPGIVCYYLAPKKLFKQGESSNSRKIFITGLIIGGGSVVITCFLFALALFCNGKEFIGIISAVLIGHIPVVIIDACVTGAAISFVFKIRPDVFTFFARKRRA